MHWLFFGAANLLQVIVLDDHDDVAWSQLLERCRFVPPSDPHRTDLHLLELVRPCTDLILLCV